MSASWLTKDDALAAPVPVAWWEYHLRLGDRLTMERVYTLSTQLSALFSEQYSATVNGLIEAEGYTNDPRGGGLIPVYKGGRLLFAMYEGQQSALGIGVGQLTDRELAGWIQRNDSRIVELVLWHLAYRFADTTFRSSAFVPDLSGPGEKPQMSLVLKPELTALGCANHCVMTFLNLPKPGHDLFDWQFALMMADQVWPLPPYPFGVNGQRV